LNNNIRLINILKRLEPQGHCSKSDLDSRTLFFAILKILNNERFFSHSVNELLNNRIINDIYLDHIDILLLKELGNGAKSLELRKLIPLTKSGIDKRKRVLRNKFEINSSSNRDLVLMAKSMGFI